MADKQFRSQYDLADLLYPERRPSTDFETLDVPLEKRRLVTDSLDFTVSTIVDLIDDGDIFIPEFQRRYVWSFEQASRLIESLIIQCPIPNIYVSEEPDDRLLVVDGTQRTLTIYNFMKDRFALSGLTAYPDLNGLRYTQLDPRFQRHIASRPLRFVKILKETHPPIKFDVFERINTGSVKLNAQELRHGLYYGPLMQTLDLTAKEEFWQTLASQGRDDRMKSSELLLRFWALRFELDRYKKPLENFLNDFASRHRNEPENVLKAWVDEAKNTASLVTRLFGRLAFRSIDKRGHITKLINTAIFDAEMVGLATFEHHDELARIAPSKSEAALRDFLTTDEEFTRSVSASTSDERQVQARIRKFREFLATL